MDERTEYYPYYEKLVRRRLEEPIAEALEYKVFAERYPHIAESLKLKREIKRLKEKLKSLEDRSARCRTKREIIRTKAKLKRESVLKRLHRENKQESIFNIRFTIATSKELIFLVAMRVYNSLQKGYISLREEYFNLRKNLRLAYMNFRKAYRDSLKALRRLMHRKVPPSVFDLKSLHIAEKGLALREWSQSRHKKVASQERSG